MNTVLWTGIAKNVLEHGFKLGIVVNAFSPTTWEADLYEFKVSLSTQQVSEKPELRETLS